MVHLPSQKTLHVDVKWNPSLVQTESRARRVPCRLSRPVQRNGAGKSSSKRMMGCRPQVENELSAARRPLSPARDPDGDDAGGALFTNQIRLVLSWLITFLWLRVL